MASHQLDMTLLGKRFTLSCGAGETEELKQAAALLEDKVQQLKGAARKIDADHLLLLVALNLSHDLLKETKRNDVLTQTMEQRINQLQQTLDKAIASNVLYPQPSK